MIAIGLIVLILGVVAYFIGKGIPSRPVLIAGQCACAVGAILLVAGLIVLLVAHFSTGDTLDVHAMRALVLA